MANIPYEIYKELEESLGKERAERLTKAFEKYFEIREEELKTKLKEELKDELLTKGEFYSEIKRLEEKIESETKRLEEKITNLEKTLDLKIRIWFILVIALILFTNKGTLEWLFKLFGLIK